MFTNRFSLMTIGLAIALSMGGCAAPVEEQEPVNAPASEEGSPETTGEVSSAMWGAPIAAPLGVGACGAGIAAPIGVGVAPAVGFGGLGWGGVGWGGVGWGGAALGGLGWGGLGWGAPGYAYGYSSPWGFGYSRAIGYGTSFGYPGYGGFFW